MYIILIFTLLFPVGAFLLLPLAMIFAIAGGKSRLVLKALTEDKAVMLLSFGYVASIFTSRLLTLSILTAAMIALQLAYLGLIKTVLDRSDLKVWYGLMNTAAIIMCAVALIQFASGQANTYTSWVDQKSFGEIKRIYSTLYNPNIFAGYLAINLSWAVSRQSLDRADAATLANILLSSVCLVLTYSRGGFLAFCAAVMVIFIFTGRKRLLIYAGVMAVSFYAVNHTGAVNRFDYASVMADSSNTYRMEVWKAGIKMFLERPLLGNGIGTAWALLSTYSDKLYRYVLHAHNIFIQAAAETGIVGAAALAYFFARNAMEAVKSWKKAKKEEASFVFLGFAASLASILVHGMIDAVILLPSLSMIFIGYYAMYRIMYIASQSSMESPRTDIGLFKQEIA